MRIQHNIMAMNSYRNLSGNNTALSKNLEKLSSGYRINRAGDDAAGLAISEKMRAQIAGLDQAQKNAQSGINLVKTAEGALTEVHDMLNRMVTLASQSANGTYTTTDREKLQAEVNALTEEIDRIADNSNFNGAKLLDGSLDANGAKVEINQSKLDAVTLSSIEAQANPAQYHKDASPAAKTSFTVDLGNINHNATGDIGELTFALIGGEKNGAGLYVNALSDANGNAIKYELGSGKIDGADVAKAIMDAIGSEGKVTLNLMPDSNDFTKAAAAKIEYQVEIGGENNDQLIFTMTDDGYNTAVAAGEDNLFRGNFTTHLAADIDATWGTNIADLNGTALAGAATNTDADTAFMDDATAAQKAFAESMYAGDRNTLSQAVSNIKTGGTGAEQLFQGMINNSDIGEIKDGAGFKIGDEYYVWALSEETLNGTYGDNVKVVDLTDMAKIEGMNFGDGSAQGGGITEADGAVGGATGGNTDDAYTARQEVISRLVEAAKDNEMFHIGTTRQGVDIVVTEKATNPSDADLTSANALKKVIQSFDNFNEVSTVTKEAGDALTLQIGADSVETIGVGIASMKAEDLGIKGLDISTAEGANKAIDTIKAAIEQVSVTRGDLGAIQNRLEHTINNLGVMEENIQDAESNIRDTDIADEMMAYTKNNILIQSAQAMLAQANQVPQGVLQLMG